jgi:lysozyme
VREINKAGIDLVKRFEGCKLAAYKCPAGVWTIGYGHTGDVKEGMRITPHQADVILDYDLGRFAKAIHSRFPSLNENQYAACVSLAFNIGVTRFLSSTLAKRIAAKDFDGAADEFLRWDKAGGKVLAGLVRRRIAERDLFLTPLVTP